MARVPGRNRDKPALVLHGHLDVVPAIAEDWSVDPFAGEIRDGMLWGRGAVDMKDMDAMILTSVADILRSGEQPERDLVLAFFADEENGGVEGSALVVQNKPEWFAGATEAISEVGGYSIAVGDRRAYLLQVGEKALVWIRLVARGRAAHGSSFHGDNAVTRLAAAVAALGRTEWPVQLTDTTREMVARLGDLTGAATDDPDALAAATGAASGFLRATLRTTTNPTGLTAGYKHNVIPDRAEALIDVRTLPGTEQAALDDILRHHRDGLAQALLGDPGNVLAIDGDAAMLRIIKPLQQHKQAGLAAAGLTDQPNALAGLKTKAAAVEHLRSAGIGE